MPIVVLLILIGSCTEILRLRAATRDDVVILHNNNKIALAYNNKIALACGIFKQGEMPENLFSCFRRRSPNDFLFRTIEEYELNWIF